MKQGREGSHLRVSWVADFLLGSQEGADTETTGTGTTKARTEKVACDKDCTRITEQLGRGTYIDSHKNQ